MVRELSTRAGSHRAHRRSRRRPRRSRSAPNSAETTQRPEWNALIGDARSVYSGRLLYVAHNVEEAEAVPFWDRLDAVGVSLYPPLGADDDRDGRRSDDARGRRSPRRACGAHREIDHGRRDRAASAQGAAAKPWESAEERATAPDPALQAEVLADWLAVLDRPAIHGVLIWRWFTDPDAGGIERHRFHRPGQAGGTCSDVRVDAKCANDQACLISCRASMRGHSLRDARSELVPDAEDHAVLLQRIAARIGGEAAALQRPGRGQRIDRAELEL